jgi:ATP-dependent Lon protease
LEAKIDKQEVPIPEELPLLPVREVVVFPYMILPLFVGREKSIAAVDTALSRDRLIFLAAQKELGEEEPEAADIYSVGTVAMIMRMLKLPDGRVKILVQGLAKARMLRVVAEEPHFLAQIERLHEPLSGETTLETEALMRTVRDQMGQLVSLGRNLSPEVMVVVENMDDPGSLADLVASNVGLRVVEAQELIEVLDPLARLQRVKDLLAKELEVLAVQNRIQSQAKEEMSKSQREYFLREQLRAIQGELGEADARAEDVAELRTKLEEARLPKEARIEAEKQLRRLESMHPEAAEYSMLRTYMDWLV